MPYRLHLIPRVEQRGNTQTRDSTRPDVAFLSLPLSASDSDPDVELSAFHTGLYVSTNVFASLLNDVHTSPAGSLLGLLTTEAL